MRIRFDVTPREPSDNPVSRLAADAVAKAGEPGSRRGEREVIGGDATEVARICVAVNQAFAASAETGVRVHLECDGPTSGEIEAPAALEKSGTAVAVRDLNGAGARAALMKLLAFPALTTARARRAEAMPVAGEEDGWWVSTGQEGRLAAVEALRGLACVGVNPAALAVKVVLPARCGIAALRRGAEMLGAAVVAARDFGVRLEAVGFVDPEQAASEVLAWGERKPGAGRVSSFAREAGARLVFLGESPTEIRDSRFLEAVHGMGRGAGAAIDVMAEKRLHHVLRTLIAARVVTAARGVGEGGLMTAVCGMLLGGERVWGGRLDLTPLAGARADALLFGESGARAVVEVGVERVGTVISEAHMNGVPAALIGEITAEGLLDLKTRSLATTWTTGELRAAWGLSA